MGRRGLKRRKAREAASPLIPVIPVPWGDAFVRIILEMRDKDGVVRGKTTQET